MISLITLKTCLQTRHRATLTDLALHVGSSTDAVRAALQHWVAKGKVRRVSLPGGASPCGGGKGCGGCHGPGEEYEWIG